jgi:hypothetical protein
MRNILVWGQVSYVSESHDFERGGLWEKNGQGPFWVEAALASLTAVLSHADVPAPSIQEVDHER